MVEGHHYLKYKKLYSLSEQQLVDCAGKNKCDYGNRSNALTYLKTNKHMQEGDYPYTGKWGSCKASSSRGVTKVIDLKKVTKRSMSQLQAAI